MRRLRVLMSRALDLLLGTRRDRRLDAEVELHLALLADEGLAEGLTVDEARAQARRRFGGVDQVKTRYRDQRGLPVVDALGRDVRFAWRVLARDRGFTATAVLVLALGIGVNNMMFTILNAHTIRGLPLQDPDRVVYVSTRDVADADRGLTSAEFDELRRSLHAAEIAAFTTGPSSLGNPNQAPDRVDRGHVTADTLSILAIRPMLGRDFAPADDVPGAPAVALLSERVWRNRYGGEAGILGRTVLVDGAPTTVVGIVQTQSGFPSMTDMWQPMGDMRGLEPQARASRTLRVVGRLRTGATVHSARAEIEAFRIAPGFRAPGHQRRHPDPRRHHQRALPRAVQDPAWMAFMAVGCLVALISCANVANLLLGRALQRHREMALRTSLGASRPRLVRQLLIESAVLAGAGGGLGVALAIAGVRLFRQGIPENVLPYWLDYSIDARVIAALVAVSALATIAIGLAPAVQASRVDPQAVLRQGGPTLAEQKHRTVDDRVSGRRDRAGVRDAGQRRAGMALARVGSPQRRGLGGVRCDHRHADTAGRALSRRRRAPRLPSWRRGAARGLAWRTGHFVRQHAAATTGTRAAGARAAPHRGTR